MKNIIPFLTLAILFIFSCNSDDEVGMLDDDAMDATSFQLTGLDGKSQKGPYLIGSSITIFELDNDFQATGLSFAEEIVDNQGSFSIGGTDLASSFVEMRANGFYYNEVLDENSSAPLTLNAISDLKEKANININILTSLEKKRVEFLIGNGSNLSEAKTQALTEVLQVFEIENANINEAELLDLTQAGDPNAILLAVSTILQGYDGVADLSALISSISSDLEEDGVLDNENLCIQLKSNASLLRLSEIRSNMEGWLAEQGIGGTVADFEKFVNQFIDNSPCESDASILYPETGKHGANILSATHTSLPKGTYSMAAELNEGTTLAVEVKGNNWVFGIGQTNTGWDVGDWDPIGRQRVFTSNRTGEIDFQIQLRDPLPGGPVSDIVVISTFENGSSSPTWVKNLRISDVSAGISYPDFGDFGGNLLAGFGTMENPMDGSPFSVSLAAFVPEGQSVEVEIAGEVWSIPDPQPGTGWEIINMTDNVLRLSATGEIGADFELILSPPCDPNQSADLLIDVYENGDIVPSIGYSETIESEFHNMEPFFHPSGQFGENIFENQWNNLSPGTYSMAVDFEGEIKVVMSGSAWNIPDPIEGFGWNVEPYDDASASQTFTSIGGSSDIKIELVNSSGMTEEIQVEYFLGCGDDPFDVFSIFVE